MHRALLRGPGQRGELAAGVADADRQRFAGSILTMAAAVRFMVREGEIELAEAARMAATVPAALLGIGERKGTLAPGADADVVILDDSLEVRATICRGEVVFRAEHRQ